MGLQLIRGGNIIAPKTKPDLAGIYLNALVRTTEKFRNNPDDRLLVKRVIFYGVKAVNFHSKEVPKSYETLSEMFEIICSLKNVISTITPNELLTIFPLRKVYDGARYQTKDYFSSMVVLKEIGMNNPIGSNVDELLWDYMNLEVNIFNVNLMSVLDGLRRFDGGKGLLEEFFENQGTPLTSYTNYRDGKGKEVMMNNSTGEIMKVRKKTPRYLRAIRKE
jgi:hypothetical protein